MGNLNPNYYNKFECLGSECSETCCQGWNIDVDHNSHLKLNDLSRKCDDNIEKFLIKSRNPTHDKFSYINMKKNGFCPFLDKNQLCGIQKKYGENYLPETCKNFPRRTLDFDTVQVKTLSLACPEVARLCLSQKDSMKVFLNEKQEVNFLKIVPNHLHNSYTKVGEQLFNRIFTLFNKENLRIPNLLIICESILNEQKNLEVNPNKIDSVLDFLVNQFKKLDFLNFDRSIIKLNFLNDLNIFFQKTLPKSSLSPILSKIQNELVEKFSNLEEASNNFKIIDKMKYENFEKKNYRILRNYFLNEMLGHAQIFTNQTPNCRNRFYLTILCAIVSKIITTGNISENPNKNHSEDILINSIQKVAKNFSAFIIVDENQEYKFDPEICAMLEKIDKNNIFNALFLLFD
tara:strand:- start:184 stop:1392 length:1209 start_codon:yes stop_codon:yes gene_type:complete